MHHHVASQREAEARTPTGARTTRITWKRAIGRFESRDTHHARVRGGREVRAPSLPPARRGTLATHFSPRHHERRRDTRRLRLRGSRASARTPGIAPDLRPTERAPKRRTAPMRAHPVTAPRDGRNLAGASSPRAHPPQRTLLSRSSRPHSRRRGSLPRPSSAARAASSTPNPHDIDIAPFHRRSPRVCSRAKTSTRASHPRRATYTGSSPSFPFRVGHRATLARVGPLRAPPDDDDDDNARRRLLASRVGHRDSPSPEPSPSRAQASLPSRA